MWGLHSGRQIIGYMLRWGLYGVLCLQIYLYFLAVPGASVARKGFVRGLLLLETINEVIMAYEALDDFKLTFDRHRHKHFRFTWLWLYVLGGLTMVAVQCFYATQLHHMGRSKVVTAFIAMTAIVCFAGRLYESVFSFKLNIYEILDQGETTGVFQWVSNSFGVASAFAITAAMICQLFFRDNAWIPQNTTFTTMLRTLTDTAILPAICSIFPVVMRITRYQQPYLTIPSLISERLYAISIMAFLNSEMEILGGRIVLSEKHNTINFAVTVDQSDLLQPSITDPVHDIELSLPRMSVVRNVRSDDSITLTES
ncbi:hypothetical protein BDZ94DRAFT_638992 [Collybia nuda]|uniref:Uncharacterized protein n=1 Tax=Collybia nuda TaxID=64659 RepID=A0A9P6CER2_9AGAR|nr:hypothetical protein BDZ94DRAFT_638992 [Collybia nuda]